MSVDAGFVKVEEYIIKKTPIGHLGKSFENLHFFGEQVMETDDVKNEIHNFGETHLSPVQNNLTNSKLVISNLTKDGEGFYYYQGQKVKFKIENGEVKEAQEADCSDELREAVENKVKE